jgi:hypothetical protein
MIEERQPSPAANTHDTAANVPRMRKPERDRGFESCSLQRGVSCEPDFRPRKAAAIARAAAIAATSTVSVRRLRSTNVSSSVKSSCMAPVIDDSWSVGGWDPASKVDSAATSFRCRRYEVAGGPEMAPNRAIFCRFGCAVTR